MKQCRKPLYTKSCDPHLEGLGLRIECPGGVHAGNEHHLGAPVAAAGLFRLAKATGRRVNGRGV